MTPRHYTTPDPAYEPIKVIEAWDLDFSLGNVLKYIARAGRKGDAISDLRKAMYYLQRTIDRHDTQAAESAGTTQAAREVPEYSLARFVHAALERHHSERIDTQY